MIKRHKPFLKTGWALGMAATMAFSAGLRADTDKVALAIDGQNAGQALLELSQNTGVQIIFTSDVIDRVRLGNLNGQYTLVEALDSLLAGTNLAYSFTADNMVVIKQNQNDGSTTSENQNRKSEAKSRVIDEVIVTAQKREENLQDVPIAITVLDGEFLDSSTLPGVTEILRTIPGIDVTPDQSGGGTGGALISARGVSNSSRYTGSGPIAYYIDGVPYGSIRNPHYPAGPDIYDLERIEFLAGPQGTLYGANALNGVVRILTRNANLDTVEFKARTSVSSTRGGGENYGGDMAFNIPIVEGKLAMRAVAGYRNDSGWVDAPFRDDINDEESQNYRLKLRAQPTDTLSIDLSAWRSEADRGAPSMSGGDRRSSAKHKEPGFDEFSAYGLAIDKQFPTFSVSSVTSYIDYSSGQVLDAEGPLPSLAAQLNSLYASKVFSEEINFTSSLNGPWRWSAGAFYRDAEDLTRSILEFHPPSTLKIISNDFTDTSESMAVYGEVGRRFHDDMLELSLGLRYFRDEQTSELNQQHLSTGVLAPLDSEFDAVTPRVVLSWMPTDNKTVYASYSQGFRSGLAQSPQVRSIFPELASVEPDTLTNYEIGSKGTAWDGRVSYTAALFYIDWQDVQQSVGIQVPDTALFATGLINGESASGLGAELAITARPLDGLEISANASWNDLTLDADVVSQTAAGSFTLAREGERLTFSPEYTLGGSLAYSFPLGESGLLGRFALSANYKPAWVQRTIIGTFENDPSFVAGARIEIEMEEHWKTTLYADNLTDEDRAGNPAFPGFEVWVSRLRPRTLGVQFEYQFGR